MVDFKNNIWVGQKRAFSSSTIFRGADVPLPAPCSAALALYKVTPGPYAYLPSLILYTSFTVDFSIAVKTGL